MRGTVWVSSRSLTSVSFVQNLLCAGGSVPQELTFQVSQGYCRPLRGTASMDPSLICTPLPNLAGHPGSWGALFWGSAMLPPTTPTKPSRVMQLRNLPLRGEAVILPRSNRGPFHGAQPPGEGVLWKARHPPPGRRPLCPAPSVLWPSLKRKLYFPGVSFIWTCRPGGPSSKVSTHPRRKGWAIPGRFQGAGGRAGRERLGADEATSGRSLGQRLRPRGFLPAPAFPAAGQGRVGHLYSRLPSAAATVARVTRERSGGGAGRPAGGRRLAQRAGRGAGVAASSPWEPHSSFQAPGGASGAVPGCEGTAGQPQSAAAWDPTMRPFCSAACAQEAPLTGATRPPPRRASRLLQEPAGAGWPWGSRPHVLPPPPSQTKPAPSGPVALAPRFTLHGPFDFFPLLSSSLPRPPPPAASWTAFSFVPPPSQAALNTQLQSTLPLPRCPLLRELNTFMISATAPFSLYFSTRR